MTLDVRGGLKNTAINHSEYVVFEEMLSNAIDSYLIRKSEDNASPAFSVNIEIELIKADLLGNELDLDITCSDNGAGFGDAQVKAFVTKDSTYKDDLQIQGIGKCKGAGRIQYFHHFNSLSLASSFQEANGIFRRTLNVDANTREISESSFIRTSIDSHELITTIRLKNRRIAPDYSIINRSTNTFSCHSVAAHLYKSFLQRLIILKGLIGKFSISVTSKIGENIESTEITDEGLPEPLETKYIQLICTHGKSPKPTATLKATRYSLPAEKSPDLQHEIALCANSAIVQPITKNYLKKPSDRKNPIDGRLELILVESESLEPKVNQQRDGFNIPPICGMTEDLEGDFSLEDIIESLEDYVYNIITPKDFDRNELIRATQDKFGITPAMLEATHIKVHYSDTEENIAKRVLKKYQDDIVKDTYRFIEMKQELLNLDPRTEGFREKINELSWKYTSTIKKIDMTNLSQLVVRRSAMIEVLRHAVDKLLTCQQVEPGKRNENEKIIHNIFFPTGKDDSETKDHDIWLLNEEYQYFEHIASDKALSSLTWLDGGKVFDSDVDESLEKLFKENNSTHGAKRPDIAIFTQEGAVIIIEFKAPGVPIQEHINDLAQYSRLLAAKSHGKIKKFYGYLIGTTLEASRMPTGWTRFPSGEGYFQTGAIEDPSTGTRYGELYSELLFYNQFINRAERRLSVYKDKLNVQL